MKKLKAVMAYVDAFIHDLPNGYATKVGERGVKLLGTKTANCYCPSVTSKSANSYAR